jgi:hypothetical protein
MQGYLFSKPLPPRELAKLLRSTPVLASPPLQPESDVATVASTAMSTTKDMDC